MVLFASLLFSSCQQGSKNKTPEIKDIVYNINLEECLKSPKTLKLSDISSSVEYFELKTPKELPISVSSLNGTKDYIFINCKGVIHQFDLRGNYIRQIGSIGNGPKEYFGAGKTVLDEFEREIYIPNDVKQNTLVFSFDGEYIETIDLKGYDEMVVNRDTIYMSYITSGYQKNKMIALENFKDTLYSIPNYNLFDTKGVTFGFSQAFNQGFYKYNDDIYFKGFTDNDTIWNINGNNHKLHAIINMGKFKRPEAINLDGVMEIFSAHLKHGDFYNVNGVLEDDLYIYMNCVPYYNPEMGRPFVVYDKQAMQGFLVQDEHENPGFKDDIAGGPNFRPLFMNDEFYVTVVEAIDFIENVENSENSENKSESFKKFINSIDENSNPIVTLVKRE